MKGKIYTVVSKFLMGTITGIRFFFIQLFLWIAIELFLYLAFGYIHNWGGFGTLALALQMCMLVYTMLFSWFYSFVSIRHCLKTAFMPYLLYASLVYLGIVGENDWNFQIVTIDEYMLMGWLVPVYGLFVLVFKKAIKKGLSSYPRFLNILKRTLDIVIILCICFFILNLLISFSWEKRNAKIIFLSLVTLFLILILSCYLLVSLTGVPQWKSYISCRTLWPTSCSLQCCNAI